MPSQGSLDSAQGRRRIVGADLDERVVVPGQQSARQGAEPAGDVEDAASWPIVAQQIAVDAFVHQPLRQRLLQPALRHERLVARLRLVCQQAPDPVGRHIVREPRRREDEQDPARYF